VCQDVAASFRRQFPGLGARALTEPIVWGGAEAGGGQAMSPATPGCTAFARGSSTRLACLRARAGLQKDARQRYYVWAALQNAGEAYGVCAELGQCDALPPADATGAPRDDTNSSHAVLQCYNAARTSHCGLDPACPALRTACSDTCTACLWLMRSWPGFNGVCRPPVPAAPAAAAGSTAAAAGGGKAPGKKSGKFRDDAMADLPVAAVSEVALLEASLNQRPTSTGGASTTTGASTTSAGGASTTGTGAPASTAAAAAPLTESAWRSRVTPAIIPRGLGSPPLEVSDVNVGASGGPDGETVQAACFSLWNAVAALPDAVHRLTAEDSRLLYPWDALTACRCLGRCPYNSIDALAVQDACGQPFEDGAPDLAARRMLSSLLPGEVSHGSGSDGSGRSMPQSDMAPAAHMQLL